MSCNCGSANGQQTVDKVRMKGISNTELPQHHTLTCVCGEVFTMKTFETNCPSCNMTFAVTPCSADKAENVKSAGINY